LLETLFGDLKQDTRSLEEFVIPAKAGIQMRLLARVRLARAW
jgi:hypothetical protein